MPNTNLANAKTAKNDEFYTQYPDIQKEMNAYVDYNPDVFRDKCIFLPCDDPEWSNFTKFFAQNFELLGLRKLISTSYAPESKKYKCGYQLTLFETEAPQYDPDKTKTHGKIFILDRDINGDNRIDINDLKWDYLEGDGDFRSKEIRKLLEECDIVATNPPFSLFREFMDWLIKYGKQFIIIGNKNAITYKEIFPLIRDNKMWVGRTPMTQDLLFEIPKSFEKTFIENGKNGSNYKIVDGKILGRSTSIWLTNVEHGRRHEPLRLMTMADNFKHSKHKEIRGRNEYIHYENYDAIEVPFSDAIPSDYDGIMGVPISFLDRYCPEQFEIIGQTQGDSGKELGLKPFDRELKKLNPSLRDGQLYYNDENGIPQKPYARILIRKKQ